jgi:hypothetical protein
LIEVYTVNGLRQRVPDQARLFRRNCLHLRGTNGNTETILVRRGARSYWKCMRQSTSKTHVAHEY